MATSIDDILAAVTGGRAGTNVQDDTTERQNDLQLLTRAWTSERVSPELMPYPAELIKIKGGFFAVIYQKQC